MPAQSLCKARASKTWNDDGLGTALVLSDRPQVWRDWPETPPHCLYSLSVVYKERWQGHKAIATASHQV